MREPGPKPDDTRLRLAAASDVMAIEDIVCDAYAPYVARLGRAPAPMRDDYDARVRRGEAWVLEETGTIVGLVVLQPAADYLLIDNVAVAPICQRRGLGRRLLSFAEDEARRCGFAELRLYTNEMMHENIALYGHCGWIEYARGEQAGYRRVFMRKPVLHGGDDTR